MADYGTETLEDLEAKLQEYRSSLATVETALEGSTSEPQLTRLRNDLVEVISLTEDIIKFRISEGEGATRKQKGSRVSTTRTTVRDPDNGAATVAAFVSDPATDGISEASKFTATNLIGRSCVTSISGTKRFGEICSVKSDNDDVEMLILVIEFIGPSSKGPSSAEVPSADVQILPLVPNLTAGTKCQAIAKHDGQLHTCVIEENLSKKSLYKVKFLGLSVTEMIKYDQVFTPRTKAISGEASSSSQAQQKTRKRKIKEIVTPGGYRIPEYLAAKPTDSQHQILAKKKKVHLLKKEQRKEIIEKAAVQRQSAWLTHNRKVSSSRRCQDSIFTTSENPAARVGITNSGKGMTSFDKRERHEYDEFDDV